jgi:hypothetical protein
LLALAAVALALWWARGLLLPAAVAEADTARGRNSAARPPAARAVAANALALIAAEVCSTPEALPSRGRFGGVAHEDPFTGPRPVLLAAATPRPPKPFVGPPLPPPPPPPAPPPPPPKLPYRFMGVLREANQPTSVFLALGEKLLFAHVGETLEGGFRLETIGARELTFVHLQQNVTVRMPVDGEPS